MKKKRELPIADRWRAPLAALLAASALVASVAPSSAFTTESPSVKGTSQDGERSAFHRHFYRGVPYGQTSGVAGASMMEADAQQTDTAPAYCASRFKSYDPSTGTYLGFDGYEHACP